MKKMSKIMGLFLTVVLLASLLVMAAPVSAADPLQWNAESVPTAGGLKLVATAGTDVADIAVAGDGTTIWAAPTAVVNNTVYKSTDSGATWSPVSTVPTAGGIDADLVAVAPDNNNIIAIVDRTALLVYVSTNGGATWGSLGIPGTVANPATVINDIDISAVGQGQNYLAVAGIDTTGPIAAVWYYNLGIGGTWTVASALGGFTAGVTGLAVKFSPNFASDLVLTAVTATAATTHFQIFSVNSLAWNNIFLPGSAYPVILPGPVIATNASIALSPTYLGGDEVERVAFVGTADLLAAAGVFRVLDTNATRISTALDIYSIAYDGVSLVAGTTTTTVYRSANALETSPTFFPSAGTKSPGGATNTVVAFAGETVVAGTTGDESAFAVSTDNGASFNDLSLIDTALTAMNDVAVSADGSVIYLSTQDADVPADTSIWRYDTSWQRVLSLPGQDLYIVRIDPANPDIIYVVATAGSTTANAMYYSKLGGDTKWFARTGPVAAGAADLAVESELVAYIGGPAGLQKTTNGGFTWGPPGNTKLLTGPIYTITVISESNVLVGGPAGDVSYSTDGGATWTAIPLAIVGGGNVQVTASGLAANDNIYASGSGVAGVYRWTIGQAATTPWKQINATAAGTGIALKGPVLYGATAAAVVRSTIPFVPNPPPFDNIAAAGFTFNNAPSALRLSSTADYNKLWAIDTTGVVLYSYMDTLAVIIPAVSTPATDHLVTLNSISGAPSAVVFTWPGVQGVNPPGGTYELQVALDEAFSEIVFDDWGTAAVPAGTTAALNAGPPTISVALVNLFSPGETYYWRMKVRTPVSSGWSEARTFTIEAAPAISPQIVSPEAGGSITATQPSFSWSPVGGTTQYSFQLTDDPTFATTITDATLATTAIKPAATLTVGTTYYWRVKALAPVEGEWSTIATFTVAAPPAAAPPPVTITQAPAPTINIPAPTQTIITIPPPEPAPQIAPAFIWAIIIIGAILVIAVIVLIVRTRRTV